MLYFAAMTELERTIQGLMMDPNPVTRLFGIDVLVQNQHRIEAEAVIATLQGATNDRDDEVARGARLAMSRLLQMGFGGSDRLREMGINSRMSDLTDVEKMRELEIRRTALEFLQPLLSALRPYIPGHAMAAEALVLLGALRDNASIHLIINALGAPSLRERAFDALQAFQTPEVRILATRLVDREQEPRTLARLADVLGDSGSVDALAPLEKLLGHPVDSVRERAALALGKLPRRAVEPVLLAAWGSEQSQSVQLVLLSSLARLGKESAAEAIIARVGVMADDRVLSKAMMALGSLGSMKALAALAGALPSQHARVRANALEALSRLPVAPRDAVDLFFPYLQDRNNRVRGNAIVAIASHDAKRALEDLKRMMTSDRPTDRATGAWVASQLQTVESAEQLALLAGTENDKTVLAACHAALSRLRNPRVRSVLQRLLRHPNPVMRQQAVLAYGRVGGPAVLRELETMYQQCDHDLVRAAIVTAMGGISHPGNLAFLQKKLGDRNEKVVAAAIEALDRVGSLDVAVMLEPFTNHSNARIRASAVVALWGLGNAVGVPELSRMLASADEYTQRAALSAVEAIHRSLNLRELEKRPMLQALLTDRMRKALQAKDDLALSSAGAPPQDAAPDRTDEQELALVAALKALMEMREDVALQALKSVLARDPRNGHAQFLLTRLTAASASRYQPPQAVVMESRFLYFLAEQLKAAKASGDAKTLLAAHFEVFSLQAQMLAEFVRLGRAYLERGDQGGAGAVARFVISQLQWTEDMHRYLGMLYLADKDYEKAYCELWKACLNSPDEGTAHLELARAAVGIGKVRLARELTAMVLASDKQDSRVQAKAAALAEKLTAGKKAE
ncbi:MAG: HEAT repeat domain-containing protein [Candidatus Riflebacteria bacterium]|nr:HEAT repeat domain-containing protein [Candidatus Riflebacteria bacterium]